MAQEDPVCGRRTVSLYDVGLLFKQNQLMYVKDKLKFTSQRQRNVRILTVIL